MGLGPVDVAVGGSPLHSWIDLTGAKAGHFPPPAVSDPNRDRDRELLGGVARGEIAALRAIYDQYSGRAMAIAVRILKNPVEAEDVVQETFIELWRRAPSYDHLRGGVVAWVVTIARSRAIDRLRSAGSSSRAVEAAQEELVPPTFPQPLELTQRRQDYDQINKALSRLPEAQRCAITLSYFDGLTQSEIAAKTGDPLGTVKMRVRLGLKKLAELLGEHKETLT